MIFNSVKLTLRLLLCMKISLMMSVDAINLMRNGKIIASRIAVYQAEKWCCYNLQHYNILLQREITVNLRKCAMQKKSDAFTFSITH